MEFALGHAFTGTNKWDSMAADVPSEARLNPGQWGLSSSEFKTLI